MSVSGSTVAVNPLPVFNGAPSGAGTGAGAGSPRQGNGSGHSFSPGSSSNNTGTGNGDSSAAIGALGNGNHSHGPVNGTSQGTLGGIPTRSPRTPQRHVPGNSSPIAVPTGTALAQQLHIQLMAATTRQPTKKRSMSRSAPTSPMARPFSDLAPLSSITPIDLGSSTATAPSVPTPQATNGANGISINGASNVHGNGSPHAYTNGSTVQGQHPARVGEALGLSVASSNRLSPSAPLQPPFQAPVPPSIPSVPQISPETRAQQMRFSPELQMRPLKPLSPLPPPNSALPSSSLVGVPAAQAQRSHPAGGTPQRGATIPPPQGLRSLNRRNRSRSRSRVSSSGSEDTETEVDSDSTFVPGRVRHQHSRSQPDLSALRSRLVEGWADGVRREQLEERRLAASSLAANNLTRRRSHGRKTPPMRPVPLGGLTSVNGSASTSAFASSVSHGSHLSRHSPRQSTTSIPMITPIRTSIESSGSESSMSPFSVRSPLGGMTGSEDADDDFESTDSLSSGSLTFSPKHRGRHVTRQRSLPGDKFSARALGLMLEPQPSAQNSADEAPRRSIDLKAASIEARLRRSSLLSFRLLAIVPALWGIAVLAHALVTGALWHDVWPWGVDFSREALERLIAGDTVDEAIRLPIHRGDMVLAIAWACLTAHFCFCLTTGLTHRWRNYYSLPSTVTRLVSLQCLCWPATYLTLSILGSRRPLLAWVVIGVTTGWSRTVQMWVTSNVIIDSPHGGSDPGDVTPGPFARVSPPPGARPMPRHVRGWRVFTHNRRWSWDLVARKVGWKVGAMLLVTCAWLFWRLENVP